METSSQIHHHPQMKYNNHPLSPPLRGGDNEKDDTAIIAATTATSSKADKAYMLLLVLNYMFLFIGSVSSSLLSKFYFNHNGSSRWVSTWVQCAGFPLLILPIFLPFYLFKSTQRKPFSHVTPKLFLYSLLIGLLLGLNNLLFSWGNSYLPISTSSLLLSSQLTFNLIFSIIIVKQKLTFSNLNCVVLLSLASVLLGLGSSNDKPNDLTREKYFVGYFCTIGAGLLFALYLPLMEIIYKQVYCYSMVMEMQLIMEASATLLATVGMAFNGGFSEMRRESLLGFDLGQQYYWLTVIANVVTWQLCFMGTAGVVFLTTGLTGAICMTALTGANVIGGVVVYGDKFDGGKAVSALLCGWGFCSYVYGLYVKPREGEIKGQKVVGGANDNYDDDNHSFNHHQVQRSELSEVVVA